MRQMGPTEFLNKDMNSASKIFVENNILSKRHSSNPRDAEIKKFFDLGKKTESIRKLKLSRNPHQPHRTDANLSPAA